MEEVKNRTLTGERALYHINDTIISECVFEDGESPLKECSNLVVNNTTFRWKYPLWYSKNVIVNNSLWENTARSGIWYTNHLVINNSNIIAPKQFRRCDDIELNNVILSDALETFWSCNNIRLNNCKATGDYFGMNSSNIVIHNFYLDGNYCFDGGSNITIFNSILNSKDAFWNCNNVTIYNSKIVGEYLAWNSNNITFINCEIESNQGLCYMDNVKLIDCKLTNTDLAFELCSNIEANVLTKIDSIKNPISGHIHAKSIDDIIFSHDMVDKDKTLIEVDNND